MNRFSKTGLVRLRETMAGHVRAGRVPGVVIGLSSGGEEYVDAIGSASGRGGQSLSPAAIFRVTSMTRPVTAVAALLLVSDGQLELDEPVDGLLPELSHRRVLRRLDGPLDDTVAADRPISLRDLLTFRAGFGMILAPPDDYPILQAEQALRLCSVGPPVPATSHPPDEWMRRMGTLPLMHQPGEQWRYSTGSQILGVLVARASGREMETFYRERIFEPLGMHDTAFAVPDDKQARLVPCFQERDGQLEPFDDGDHWSQPPIFADGGAGLVSTAGDYLAFGRMLLNHGRHQGRRFLGSELVGAMTTNQLTPEQRHSAGPLLDERGWGFGVSIIDPPDGAPGPKGYGWSGGFGTVWLNDPEEDLVAVLCTQVLLSAGGQAVQADFWSAAYDALEPDRG